ncbi:MAG: hypothetical protein NTW87_27400, partial [Planctomycetota bacterium]|nr:hypothetical protein [Planctomycetota bacterium]
VALVGEVESANAEKLTSDLQKCLEKLPEVKDVRRKLSTAPPVTYPEPAITYVWGGTLKVAGTAAPDATAAPATGTPAAGAAAAPKDVTYTQFNVVFRWNDPSDPDREPVEVAAPAASAKADEPKKGK